MGQVSQTNDLPPQTHHVNSTLKRRGNDRFHVVSTWNTRGVFVGTIQKIYSKMFSRPCANSRHDVTTFEIAGMVWNTKNFSSTERDFCKK